LGVSVEITKPSLPQKKMCDDQRIKKKKGKFEFIVRKIAIAFPTVIHKHTAQEELNGDEFTMPLPLGELNSFYLYIMQTW
jgi:hypothetical protein